MPHINTVPFVSFSHNKYSYNFTFDNNNSETGIYADVNGETDLDFLTVPISIPEMAIPVTEITIPAINDVNLDEFIGLKYLTTKPTVDVNAKIVYQKSTFAPIIDLGFMSVLAVGNLVFFKKTFVETLFEVLKGHLAQGAPKRSIRDPAL
ncbi:hypothetical protein QTP70_006382 [Hemibagrus guttatus]|uniref:Apolipoprotein B n=1 Tax=Hemibagrus guttatus TaxID=175788 RepID=A0AAE0USN5_9TELE|nr:hypothetical protein QTP70_006382 [Hemibagrus guttatus]KAK3541889.1 hypothetical protein QTP86_008117 [Hemibagrus guttatus]